MSVIKKILLYLIVAILVAFCSYLFVKTFYFQKPTEVDSPIPEVTETLVDKLYNILPTHNDYGINTIYTGYYTTYQNLNYEISQNMVYDYMLKYESEKLENYSIDELPNVKGNVEPVFKIDSENFLKTFAKLFGSEAKLDVHSFKIRYNTKAELINGVFYIYNYDNEDINQYVVFKKRTKYSVTDNNATIKIYDNYVICEINTGNCYTDEKKATVNSFIHYAGTDLNLDDYKGRLKEFEHTFKYENGNYYWVSSQGV